MNEVLLSILAGVVGAQIYVVRSLVSRSDKGAEQRDRNIATLIDALTKAINSFQSFEAEEERVHGRIIDAQERIIETQQQIVTAIESICKYGQESRE